MGSSPTSKFDIGQPIVIDLTDGSSFRAFVHAYDKSSTMLCLELIPSAEVAFMSTSNVKSVAALPAADHSRKWPSIPSVDIHRARAEEERFYRDRHAKFLQTGVGVSSAAQAMFNTLAKTLPCKWDHNTIVILDTVRLSPPYDVNSISGSGDAGVVNRVRMILEKESDTIKTAASANGTTATP